MKHLIKTYHARAVPALACYALAALGLIAAPAPAFFMSLGLALLGTAFLFIQGEVK